MSESAQKIDRAITQAGQFVLRHAWQLLVDFIKAISETVIAIFGYLFLFVLYFFAFLENGGGFGDVSRLEKFATVGFLFLVYRLRNYCIESGMVFFRSVQRLGFSLGCFALCILVLYEIDLFSDMRYLSPMEEIQFYTGLLLSVYFAAPLTKVNEKLSPDAAADSGSENGKGSQSASSVIPDDVSDRWNTRSSSSDQSENNRWNQ